MKLKKTLSLLTTVSGFILEAGPKSLLKSKEWGNIANIALNLLSSSALLGLFITGPIQGADRPDDARLSGPSRVGNPRHEAAPTSEQKAMDSLACSIKDAESQIRHRIQATKGLNATRVLALGITGSGKTTLIHALAGKKLVVKEGQGRIQLEAPKDQHLEGLLIGHTASSATISPVSWHDRSSGLEYWDCPGFMDSRGWDQDIANAFAIDQLFEAPSLIKTLLVVQESEITDSRARDAFSRFEKLSKILPVPEEIYKSIVLVVTKARGEFSPYELLKGIEGSDSKLLRFFADHPERVFSFPYPKKGLHESQYNLFVDRENLIKMLKANPVVNPTHSIDLEDQSILPLINMWKSFGNLKDHVIELCSSFQGMYRGVGLEDLVLWKRCIDRLLSARETDMDTPGKLTTLLFEQIGFPKSGVLSGAIDQISVSWRFMSFLTKIQERGFPIQAMEVQGIHSVLLPVLENLSQELGIQISNLESMEKEKKHREELERELSRKQNALSLQHQEHMRKVSELERKTEQEKSQVRKMLDQQIKEGLLRESEAMEKMKRQEEMAMAQKQRLEDQWKAMKRSMEDSHRQTLGMIEEQKQSAMQRLEHTQRSLRSVEADLERIRNEQRQSQAMWESRLERAREEAKEEVIRKLSRRLAAQASPFGGFYGGGYGGGFYYG